MIEFGPNGVIEYGFGSGTGHDQEERFANAYWSQMLGVRRGSCRSCRSAYVSSTSDTAGMCIYCLGAGQVIKDAEEAKPVAGISSTARTTFGTTEHLLSGFDGLDDWRVEEP